MENSKLNPTRKTPDMSNYEHYQAQYPEIGISETTRKMFTILDELVKPAHVESKHARHLYHLKGELRALHTDMVRIEDPRAFVIELAIEALGGDA
jgi:hypothetical protein